MGHMGRKYKNFLPLSLLAIAIESYRWKQVSYMHVQMEIELKERVVEKHSKLLYI
jgi:hypothetical protein